MLYVLGAMGRAGEAKSDCFLFGIEVAKKRSIDFKLYVAKSGIEFNTLRGVRERK